MYASSALLAVLVLSIGSLSHQQSDEYVPAQTYYNARSSAVGITKLRAAQLNAAKRHIGKFVRIGRALPDNDDILSAIVPRLSQRAALSRRLQRSDLYDSSGRHSATVSKLSAKSKNSNRRGSAVRFVRIGRADGQLGKTVKHKRRRHMNVFQRSLENRFVRIG